MQSEYEVEVEWRGMEIHPEIPPEGLQWPEHLRARFGGMSDWLRNEAQEAGLEMIVPEIIPNSRRALDASEYAREQGKHEAFHKVVFQRFYGRGEDLGSWSMLGRAAEEVGLDAAEMRRRTEDGDYKAAVDTHAAQLVALGATGVPLFLFDGKYAIVGLRPYAAFREVMERIAADGEQAGSL